VRSGLVVAAPCADALLFAAVALEDAVTGAVSTSRVSTSRPWRWAFGDDDEGGRLT
jgi:hypothetical protein